MNIGVDIVWQALYIGLAFLILSVMFAGCAAVIGHGIHSFNANREGAQDNTKDEAKE